MPDPLTRNMARLVVMVPVRVPQLREGRTVNYGRNTNVEAAMAQNAGTEHVTDACLHCAGGSGVWTECVTVSGLLTGSCANCHYGSEGARCSFRKFYGCVLTCAAANGS